MGRGSPFVFAQVESQRRHAAPSCSGQFCAGAVVSNLAPTLGVVITSHIQKQNRGPCKVVRTVGQKLRRTFIYPRVAAPVTACCQHTRAQRRRVRAAVPGPTARTFAGSASNHRQRQQSGRPGYPQAHMRGLFNLALCVAIMRRQPNGFCFHSSYRFSTATPNQRFEADKPGYGLAAQPQRWASQEPSSGVLP